MLALFRTQWQALPAGLRSALTTAIKVVVTVAAFYLLLTHEVRNEAGEHVMAFRAILAYLPKIEGRTFWSFVVFATALKGVGILSSIYRWHLLLRGQGIRFPFIHVAGSFFIGRFIGTFLPSTIGLDGYKLYDAARFSGRTVEVTAATAIEKIIGFSGMFLTFLVAFPLGYDVLGEHAGVVALFTVPIAVGALAAFFIVTVRPDVVRWAGRLLQGIRQPRLASILERVTKAATAYQGQGGLILQAFGLSFFVHFTTAAMYFFTALAIGATRASFWEVTFASTIQIFATVMSPFTIAGEGVREIVQTLLLAKKIGTSESIISAALGFWAAEGLTLFGGFIYLFRTNDYRPAFVEVAGERVSAPVDEPAERRAAGQR